MSTLTKKNIWIAESYIYGLALPTVDPSDSLLHVEKSIGATEKVKATRGICEIVTPFAVGKQRQPSAKAGAEIRQTASKRRQSKNLIRTPPKISTDSTPSGRKLR